MTGLTSTELAERSGATYRQIDWWAREGLLVPANGAKGSGSRRRYHARDVTRAEVLARLSVAACGNSTGPALLLRYVAGHQGPPWIYQDGPLLITVEWEP